jgi:O-acetyl-ADP-ribose deacetylase (regulator of RNase III)
MVEEIVSDIFSAPIHVLVHQANCFGTMNSGIAKMVKEKFPDAFQADRRTQLGDKNKLGTYSACRVYSPNITHVVNMYGQFEYGRDAKHTNYEAVYQALDKLRVSLLSKNRTNLVVGIPYRMGCNLGGGDWNVVLAIIKSVFDSSPIKVLICKKPDADSEPLGNTESR